MRSERRIRRFYLVRKNLLGKGAGWVLQFHLFGPSLLSRKRRLRQRYQVPAFIGSNGAEREIQSYTRKFGESPATTVTMPHAPGSTEFLRHGERSSWNRSTSRTDKAFAEGRRLGKGYYVDFIGNFDRSAKEGFPLYRISGGAGFIWVASFDQRGRGALRLWPSMQGHSIPTSSRNRRRTNSRTAAGRYV